jgi:hypothetical protein
MLSLLFRNQYTKKILFPKARFIPLRCRRSPYFKLVAH